MLNIRILYTYKSFFILSNLASKKKRLLIKKGSVHLIYQNQMNKRKSEIFHSDFVLKIKQIHIKEFEKMGINHS